MNHKNKTSHMLFRLRLFLLFVFLFVGSVIASRAAAAQRIGEKEAIAIATGETGPNDFRISRAGVDRLSDASDPAVAYNADADEYLVVWAGTNIRGGVLVYDSEIYGQRVDAATHNPVDNQYLVVWNGSDNQGPLVAGEYEIFGQLLQADGAPTGDNDFRLSDMGPDGEVSYAAEDADVSCSATAVQCLVVWHGEDNTIPLVQREYEIFGQFYGENAAPLAAPDDYSTPADTPLIVAAPGVLENDSDPDEDTLTAALVDSPSNGSLALSADGSFTYTPVAGFSGVDTFTYRANGGLSYSDPAVVTITVNATPAPGDEFKVFVPLVTR